MSAALLLALKHPLTSALSIAVLLLASLLAWSHWVTVPMLRRDVATLGAQLTAATAQTKVAAADLDAANSKIDQQAATVHEIAADCTAKADAHAVDALRTVKQSLTVPVGHSALDLNTYTAHALHGVKP